jgi:hypothetical protein
MGCFLKEGLMKGVEMDGVLFEGGTNERCRDGSKRLRSQAKSKAIAAVPPNNVVIA